MTTDSSGAARWRIVHDEAGSFIPMIIMAFVVAGLLVTGSSAAGGAFVKQRDLESICDGAAIAAAQAVADEPYYLDSGRGSDANLPLQSSMANAAALRYAAQDASGGGEPARIGAYVHGDGVTVTARCRRHVAIPFGAIFVPGGIDQSAIASAQSETRRGA